MTVGVLTLLLIGTLTQQGLSARNLVVPIDGADIVGGDPVKFVCNNLCKQNAGPGCVVPSSFTCDGHLNQVCGEEITEVLTVMGCEKNDAGGVDPCVNAKDPEKCYKARNCACFVQFEGGNPFYSCKAKNDQPNACGNTVADVRC